MNNALIKETPPPPSKKENTQDQKRFKNCSISIALFFASLSVADD